MAAVVADRRGPRHRRAVGARGARGQPLPLHRLPQHRQGRPRRGRRRVVTAVEIRTGDRRRHPPAAQGGPPPPHRRGPLRRRPRPARRRVAGDGPQPARPRPHRHRSTPPRRRRCPACARSSPAPTSRDEWANPMPCAWPVTDGHEEPAHFPVAVDKACYVGDIVAVVVADSRYGGGRRRRRRRRRLRRRCLPVVDLEDARSDRVVIHEDLGTNTSYTWALCPDADAVEQAFAERRPHRQRALHPAAAHPDGDGAPRRGRRAGAAQRRLHDLVVDPDPPHPQGDARHHLRHRRAQDPGRSRRPSAAASARSSTSTPRS